MKKLLVMLGLSLILSSGCVMTKMLIPDLDSRLSQRELSHKSTVATKTQDKLGLLLADGSLENDKSKLSVGRLIYKSGKDANDISPSSTENLANQFMRIKSQGVLDEQLDAGFQWSKGLVTQIAGGATGTGTITALLLGYLRKKKALNVVNSELNPDEKIKIKKAMNHTGLEKHIT
jgi:hypothetical protein